MPTSTPTNHTLPEVGKIPVRQGSLISRENKEQRQEVPSSSPLEKKVIQTAVKAENKVGENEEENEIEEEPEKEIQNKLKLKRERNEESKNGKVLQERKMEKDVIEPSNSDWSNPVVTIKKPNGKYRFCLDIRKVNKITKKDLYPIPIMAEILDA